MKKTFKLIIDVDYYYTGMAVGFAVGLFVAYLIHFCMNTTIGGGWGS